MKRGQLEDLRKRQEELEAKSKADIKVLVKEVKSLRINQNELQQELNQTMKDKAELEVVTFTFTERNSVLLIKHVLTMFLLFSVLSASNSKGKRTKGACKTIKEEVIA